MSPVEAAEVRPAPSRRVRGGQAAEYVGLLLVLGVLVAIFGLTSEHFFSPATFTMLANQIPALTVVAAGLTFVLVIGEIDLSVGSVLALGAAVMGTTLVTWSWPLAASMAAALGVGLLAGLANGFVTARWALPSFIVTLGMLEIARGAAYLVTNSRSLYVGSVVEPIGEPVIGLGLSPAFFVALLVVVAGQVVLTRTVFGRYMLAIGGNAEAVRLSGVDPRPVKRTVFAIAGVLAGLGGVFQVAYLESVDPNAGLGLELSAIAAVVIGGTSLLGGRGSVVNSFFGVLIIAVLQAGLAQVGATEPTKRIVTGSVIVVAVILDAYRHRFEGWRRRRPRWTAWRRPA